MIEVGARYRSKWWEDLIAPGFDNYLDGSWDAEISGACRIGKNTRVTAGVNNLLDLPTRHYAGSLAHMNDAQKNGVDYSVGVQWKLCAGAVRPRSDRAPMLARSHVERRFGRLIAGTHRRRGRVAVPGGPRIDFNPPTSAGCLVLLEADV